MVAAGAAPLVEPGQGRAGAVVGGELQGGLQQRPGRARPRARGLVGPRSGKRRGPKIAFPKFRARHRARLSCRFSTGAIRVDDRSHVVLPRIGRIKTHERTTALLGKVTAGQARVLAATASFDRAALVLLVHRGDRACPGPPGARACRPGASGGRRRRGVRDLLVVAAPDGTEIARIPAPKPLAQAQARLRALQRRAARAGLPGPAYRAAAVEAVEQDSGADRAGPRPGSEHPPGCAAQGHHAAWPSAIRSS